MAITTKTIYLESDNLVQLTGLKDAETESYINDATVTGGLFKEALNPDASVAVDKGEGKVGIPCTGHGLSSGSIIKILETINYDDQYTVDVTTTVNEIVIAATYVAETFLNSVLIHEAVLNADSITLSYDADSNGNYNGILSDAAVLILNEWYWLIVEAVKDTSLLVVRSKRKAVYYGG